MIGYFSDVVSHLDAKSTVYVYNKLGKYMISMQTWNFYEDNPYRNEKVIDIEFHWSDVSIIIDTEEE